jgi:magnesium-transporting ATPase (P-type)
VFFLQGADNVITAKLREETNELIETLKHAMGYAEDGLRVLMIGYREILEEEYESWKENYSIAEASIENKEILVSQSMVEVETGLTLLGATAVEDRLQVRQVFFFYQIYLMPSHY